MLEVFSQLLAWSSKEAENAEHMVSLDAMQLLLVLEAMKFRNVVHPGLRSLMEEDDPTGPRGTDAMRLRRILSFLQDIASLHRRLVDRAAARRGAGEIGASGRAGRCAHVQGRRAGLWIADLDYEGNG